MQQMNVLTYTDCAVWNFPKVIFIYRKRFDCSIHCSLAIYSKSIFTIHVFNVMVWLKSAESWCWYWYVSAPVICQCVTSFVRYIVCFCLWIVLDSCATQWIFVMYLSYCTYTNTFIFKAYLYLYKYLYTNKSYM